MNKSDLRLFHRRMLLSEIRPTDEESAAALSRFMADYSQFESLKKKGMKIHAEIKFYDAKARAKELKRMIRTGQIAEGARHE